MLAVPTRHRSLALLAAAVLGQTLLLAYQIKRDSHVRLIRVWSVDSITPLERMGIWCIAKVHDTFSGYFALVHTHRDNAALQGEIDRLRMRNGQLEGDAAEARRLETLIGFHDLHADVPILAARVIAANADSASRVVFINRGLREGLHRDMAVVTPDGVVGKIWEVFQNTAEVELLTDDRSGVGSLLATSRAQGVVKGTGDASPVLYYIGNEENVVPGDQVLTSGEDQIFPKDFPVGTVTEVKPAPKGSPFRQIRIKPAARLDRLEEVIVLLTRQEINTRASEPASSGKSGATAKVPAANPHP